MSGEWALTLQNSPEFLATTSDKGDWRHYTGERVKTGVGLGEHNRQSH